MDNFEYSIQLNDRDWAEFYLASEECNLIQPALATADDQLLSDLEEGEAEEGRLIRVRVDPALAHSSASCLPQAAPDRPLLAEEIWSGSEDETDLGSVNRFLCKNSQLGTGCPQSSGTQENQLSCVTLKPPGGQSGSAAERDFLCAAKERESETGDQPSSLSVVGTAVQKEDFQKPNPKQEISERLACTVQTNLDTSERMDNPAGENGSGALCLALKHPKGDASQMASVDSPLPTLLENTAVGGNAEFLEPRDLTGYPRSVCFSSPDSIKHEGAEHLEKDPVPHQVTSMAQAVPRQEEPAVFHGHSVPVMRTLAPTDPVPPSHVEGAEGRSSEAEKDVANLRGEGRVDPSEDFGCEVLKEERQLDQVVSPTSEVVGSEDDKYLRPTLTVDVSRGSKTLDKHRDAASLTTGPERENSGERCHRLGMAVPLEEESHVLALGNQRADFFRESVHYCPILENPPESDVTVVTWPEMYDYFFCDDTQEQGGKMRDRMANERLGSNTDPSLPEMCGPEMYEYFFNEMGEAKPRGGSGDKGSKLEKISSSGHQSAPLCGSEEPDSDPADSDVHISIPEVYEHFFVSRTKDKRTWRGVFLSMPALEAKKFARALKSLVCKPAHLLRSQPTRQGALLRRGSQGRLVLLSPRLLEENQPRAADPMMAVMTPERPLRPVFSQRDMCLGFVAFASWAVKTSNLQAPDAWKIVFLANFGTLSAIRYFRRQVATGGQHGT